MKTVGLVFLVFVCAILLFTISKKGPHIASSPAIPSSALTLIYATTSQAQERGLGGRASLPANEGMLFVFDHTGPHGFWMKDMQFPIDIIWLDENKRVVHIESNVQPSSYPNVYSPEMPSRYALEVNAGYAATHSIVAGSKIDTH
jgi:uncharacterized membrane protein (UPF0127 family)